MINISLQGQSLGLGVRTDELSFYNKAQTLMADVTNMLNDFNHYQVLQVLN
jgi:hypothetical protein